MSLFVSDKQKTKIPFFWMQVELVNFCVWPAVVDQWLHHLTGENSSTTNRLVFFPPLASQKGKLEEEKQDENISATIWGYTHLNFLCLFSLYLWVQTKTKLYILYMFGATAISEF